MHYFLNGWGKAQTPRTGHGMWRLATARKGVGQRAPGGLRQVGQNYFFFNTEIVRLSWQDGAIGSHGSTRPCLAYLRTIAVVEFRRRIGCSATRHRSDIRSTWDDGYSRRFLVVHVKLRLAVRGAARLVRNRLIAADGSEPSSVCFLCFDILTDTGAQLKKSFVIQVLENLDSELGRDLLRHRLRLNDCETFDRGFWLAATFLPLDPSPLFTRAVASPLKKKVIFWKMDCQSQPTIPCSRRLLVCVRKQTSKIRFSRKVPPYVILISHYNLANLILSWKETHSNESARCAFNTQLFAFICSPLILKIFWNSMRK